MGKLTPKPTEKDPLYSWKTLDTWLQNSFKSNSNTPRSISIQINEFEMSVDEMIEEGKKAGYKVSQIDENTLIFE